MALSWSRCIICQKTTAEELRCPLRACGAKLDPRSVYSPFLQNVSEFNSLEALPISLSLPLDININVDVLIDKEASWHKSCHLQFSTSKLNKTKERAARKREKAQAQPEDEEVRASKTPRLSSHNKENCILCGQGGQLHEVTTFATDEKLRHIITELQDTTLLPKISGVDLMAAEAKYHFKCMTDLRNRYRGHISRKRQESCEKEYEKIKESQAFIELIEYIERSVDNDKLLFLLSELHSLYVTRLETLGVHKQKAIQGMLKEAVQQRDFSEDAMILAKASAIERSTAKSKTGQTRHTKAREPPLPLYIGFNVHAMTRSRTLIAKLYQMGISVSYQRIMDMLATSISERFEMDGCVAPACLRKGVFTIGALDNLDHNPSSTTPTSSFHGTGISVFQLPTESNPGEERPPVTLPSQGTGHSLQEEYATVHPVELNTKGSCPSV
ncbi:hypothetical protein OS493_001489 [Desmophyllum pertusum]|uniref:Uncharacterized protein n=1 Tax=Desmophyllum pertusum TaxID=174260 RepID=A0A9W9ZGK2_9CNID|nr:hypothetical protein OS493_001489 [Desmophyllum pertusum]